MQAKVTVRALAPTYLSQEEVASFGQHQFVHQVTEPHARTSCGYLSTLSHTALSLRINPKTLIADPQSLAPDP